MHFGNWLLILCRYHPLISHLLVIHFGSACQLEIGLCDRSLFGVPSHDLDDIKGSLIRANMIHVRSSWSVLTVALLKTLIPCNPFSNSAMPNDVSDGLV